MKKYRTIIKILLFFLLLMILVFTFINYKKSPSAYIVVELRDTEYGEHKKEVYVEVNITDAKNSSRDIYIPHLLVIDNLDKTRSEEVETSEINNISSSKAQAISRIVFDMEGLTLQQVKDCYANDLVDIDILTKKGKEIEYSFNIGELIVDRTS